jgi:hypothetical protein
MLSSGREEMPRSALRRAARGTQAADGDRDRSARDGFLIVTELTALGFIEVTEQGRSGVAYARSPNKFRLTFRHCEGRLGDGTHEWRRIDTIKRAREVAEAARTPPQKIKSPVGVLRRDQWGKPTLATDLPVGFPHYGRGKYPHYLYILGRRAGVGEGSQVGRGYLADGGLTTPPWLAAIKARAASSFT